MAGPITVDESFDASAELRLDTLTDGSSRSIWPTALTEQAPAVLDLEDNPCFQEALGEAIADVEAAKAAESMHLDADECDTAKVLDILREQLSLAKSLQVEGTLFQIEQYRVLCWAYKAQTKLLIGIRRAYEQLELTEEQKLRRHGIATNWFEQEENIYGMAVLLKNQSLHNLCEYYLGFRPGKPRLPTPHVSKL
ncbi:hypothetical protein K461DRAFT_71492 [Myriangium duriaei CBS 260.36]|uniref:Uncharacterized protein n=1 Tax=Myriangium duriaei CBS 260.36 TaxID=1168546 RepID=A0A9P4ISY2_9PEZI|nr:hypothetical protein K461DRAFT_71492 [Myriangium duriaei CBS 260.36]